MFISVEFFYDLWVSKSTKEWIDSNFKFLEHLSNGSKKSSRIKIGQVEIKKVQAAKGASQTKLKGLYNGKICTSNWSDQLVACFTK